MLRILGIVALIAVALIWVEPRWDSGPRVLTLRVRDGDEIRGFVVERARRLGGDLVRSWMKVDRSRGGHGDSASGSGSGSEKSGRDGHDARKERDGVSSAPPTGAGDAGRLTPEDQRELDRMVKEKVQH